MTVLSYIIIAILQFLILFGIIVSLRYLLVLMFKNHPSKERFFFFFNITTALIWVVFVLLKVAHSLNDNYIIVGSVVLLITLLIWDFLRNFLFGLVIRIQYGYLVNQNINYGGSACKILHYYTTYIEVRSEKGKIINIKYSTLFSGSFTIVSAELFDVTQSILFENKNHDELLTYYKSEIMNHPLYVQNNNAVFNLELDTTNRYWLHLHFNVLSTKHVLIMNDFINKLKK